MQSDTSSETIDGKKFVVFKLPIRTSQRILMTLAQGVGPAFGMALGGLEIKAKALDAKIDGMAVGQGLQHLLTTIDADTLWDIQQELAKVTHCDGTPLDQVFEAIFGQDLTLLYRWLWFALRVQYGNFTRLVSPEARGKLVALLGVLEKSSSPTSPSGGSSSDSPTPVSTPTAA